MAEYTDKNLKSCVEAGILTGQQYADVKAYVHRGDESDNNRREGEYFRCGMPLALGVLVFTYSNVLSESGVLSLNFAITGLVVGVGLLALSVYWQHCRVAALKLLPVRLQQRVAK